MQQKLTPHQFWVTQLGNTERPFTNEYWWYNDVGHYTCRVCDQNLFLYEHKFKNRSGLPTFWNSLSQAIRFENDRLEMPEVYNAEQCPTLQNKVPIKRACCSNVRNKLCCLKLMTGSLFSASRMSAMCLEMDQLL